MKNKNNKKIIMAIVLTLAFNLFLISCGKSSEDAFSAGKSFPSFTATDMDGNKVSSDIFKENSVTAVNIWFTGCKACVQEMPKLEKLSQKMSDKGGQMIGICVDINDAETKAQAQEILKKSGASYVNLFIDSNSEAKTCLDGITAFPTTLFVDRNGKLVGDPIVGSIDSQKQMDNFMKRVDEIVKKDGGQKC